MTSPGQPVFPVPPASSQTPIFPHSFLSSPTPRLPQPTPVDLRAKLSLAPPEVTQWAVNDALDRLVTLAQPAPGRWAGPYLGAGVAGLAVGFCGAFGAALWSGLAPLVVVASSVGALVTFVGAGLARRRWYGSEKHVLLPDLLLALATTAAIAALSRAPVWTTLDVMAGGLGIFLVFGRLGCGLNGCCHGHAAEIGFRYLNSPRVAVPLRGIRLFPVQWVEALWVGGITVGTFFWIGIHAKPGTAVGWFLVSYAVGRFGFEWKRGDKRRFWGPLSEAQWTCVTVVGLCIAGMESLRLISVDVSAFGPSVATFGTVLAAIGGGWWFRKRWFSATVPLLGLADVAPWIKCLETLERSVRTSPPGTPVTVASPDGTWNITLMDDPVDQGLRLYSYTLQSKTSDGAANPDQRAEVAGMILSRLPAHHVLRYQADQDGDVHLWALVDPTQKRAVDTGDDPRQLRDRAWAFSRSLHLVVKPDK